MQPITARMLRHPNPDPSSLSEPPDGAPARTLVAVLRATAARYAGRPAIDADVLLTYAELADQATVLARRLAAAGVRCGDRVGVRLSSGTADLYVAILGVLEVGAAYVPVDADDPPAQGCSRSSPKIACWPAYPSLSTRAARR